MASKKQGAKYAADPTEVLKCLHNPKNSHTLMNILQRHQEEVKDCVNYVDPDHDSHTPLQSILMKTKKGELVKCLTVLLMYSTADVNCYGPGQPPLHMAIENKEDIEVIQILIVFGADFNLQNKNQRNETPLDVARRCNHQPARKLLSDLHARNSGQSAWYKFERLPSFPEDSELPEKYDDPDYGGAGANSAIPIDSPEIIVTQFEFCKRELLTKSISTGEQSIGDSTAFILQQLEIDQYKKERMKLPPELRGEGGSRILFLDGGGIRGLVIIEMLIKLEELTQKPVTKLFDWIVGTSTGGILALALVYAKMPLEKIKRLYFRFKEEVFKGKGILSLFGFGCDSKKLEELLIEVFGTEMKMTDRQHPKVLVAAVDKRQNPTKLRFFNNCFKSNDPIDHPADDTPVWKVARYTCAAPTYFTESDEYVDGGLMANNPSQEGLKAIRDFYPSLHIALVVSLGTGKYNPEDIKQADVITCLRSYRVLDAISGLQSLIKSALQAIATDAPTEAAKFLCGQLEIPFFRFEPNLMEKIDTKEMSTEKLVNMVIETKKYCGEAETSDQLAYVVQLLHAAVQANKSQAMYRSTISDNVVKK